MGPSRQQGHSDGNMENSGQEEMQMKLGQDVYGMTAIHLMRGGLGWWRTSRLLGMLAFTFSTQALLPALVIAGTTTRPAEYPSQFADRLIWEAMGHALGTLCWRLDNGTQWALHRNDSTGQMQCTPQGHPCCGTWAAGIGMGFDKLLECPEESGDSLVQLLVTLIKSEVVANERRPEWHSRRLYEMGFLTAQPCGPQPRGSGAHGLQPEGLRACDAAASDALQRACSTFASANTADMILDLSVAVSMVTLAAITYRGVSSAMVLARTILSEAGHMPRFFLGCAPAYNLQRPSAARICGLLLLPCLQAMVATGVLCAGTLVFFLESESQNTLKVVFNTAALSFVLEMHIILGELIAHQYPWAAVPCRHPTAELDPAPARKAQQTPGNTQWLGLAAMWVLGVVQCMEVLVPVCGPFMVVGIMLSDYWGTEFADPPDFLSIRQLSFIAFYVAFLLLFAGPPVPISLRGRAAFTWDAAHKLGLLLGPAIMFGLQYALLKDDLEAFPTAPVLAAVLSYCMAMPLLLYVAWPLVADCCDAGCCTHNRHSMRQ